MAERIDIRNKLPHNNNAPKRAVGKITKIIVHHDGVEVKGDYDPIARYKQHANYHINKDWNGDGKKDGSGIMYHFTIDWKGRVYITRNFEETLWHCGNYQVNLASIAICLDGNFEVQQPTKEQLTSLKELLINLSTQHPEFPADFNDIFGHREISSTACPGKNLLPFVQEIRNKKGQIDIPGEKDEEKEQLRAENEELKRKLQKAHDRINKAKQILEGN